MTLKIGKQRELPQRPGDYRTAKGDMNQVPNDATEEADEMQRRRPPNPAPAPRPAAPAPAPKK